MGNDMTDAGALARMRIGSLFEQHAEANYIGEPVSIMEHSWQAYSLAREAGESEEACVACLLHDIGHMLGLEAGFPAGMKGCGTLDHEGIAADFLKGLGTSTCYVLLVQQQQ